MDASQRQTGAADDLQLHDGEWYISNGNVCVAAQSNYTFYDGPDDETSCGSYQHHHSPTKLDTRSSHAMYSRCSLSCTKASKYSPTSLFTCRSAR